LWFNYTVFIDETFILLLITETRARCEGRHRFSVVKAGEV